jgi:hypothetical protein
MVPGPSVALPLGGGRRFEAWIVDADSDTASRFRRI